MKKRGIFMVKSVLCGSENFTVGKSCKNQRCRRLITMKNCTYVFFDTNAFPEKKLCAKILESPICDLQKHNTPQKKPHENCHSYLKQNKRLLLSKN